MSGFRRVFERVLRAPCALGLALALAGCAAPAPEPHAPSAALQTRAFHETINLGGRLSVRYQRDGKEEALHGSFAWRQAPRRSQVLLQSPLGQAIASIDIEPGSAILTQAGQAPRSAADVDALTAETLGWPLPVSGLREWLQGFVTGRDGRRAAVLPQADANAVVTLDGWRVRFVSWEQDGQTLLSRPKRIDVERSTAQAGEVAIRIVIDSWQPN